MWKCQHCGVGGQQDSETSCWRCNYGQDGSPPPPVYEPYAEVDPTLFPWAQGYGFHIDTTFKDYNEFRDVDVRAESGRRYRISVNAPDVASKQVSLHAFDYLKERRTDFKCPLPDLHQTLDQAYRAILDWEAENAAKCKANNPAPVPRPEALGPLLGPIQQGVRIVTLWNHPAYQLGFTCAGCGAYSSAIVRRFATEAMCRSCKHKTPIVVDWSEVEVLPGNLPP